MSERVEPAPGVRLYYLDDTGLLFCEAQQELHMLNTTATLIWSLLEEHEGDEAATAGTLAGIHGIDTARSRSYVHQAVAEWRTKGFLGSDAVTPEPAPAPVPSAPPLVDEARHAARRYRLLSSRFLIRFSSEPQITIVAPVIEHLADDGAGPPTAAIDIVESDKRISVYRDREFVAACDALDQLAPIVKATVWNAVLRDEAYFLDIHAGVVSDGKRCLLLPAAPGSGKSTLTAALVHAGLEFFSDEIALLEDATLDVLPVPLALCVKDTGIDALASRYPRLRTLAIHRRGDGKNVVYLPPTREQRPAKHEARPVHALVFPRFAQGETTSLAPLPRPAALQALLSQCLRVAQRLDVHRVERLVQWISTLPCYALRHGDTESAVAAVLGLLPAHDGRQAARRNR